MLDFQVQSNYLIPARKPYQRIKNQKPTNHLEEIDAPADYLIKIKGKKRETITYTTSKN